MWACLTARILLQIGGRCRSPNNNTEISTNNGTAAGDADPKFYLVEQYPRWLRALEFDITPVFDEIRF